MLQPFEIELEELRVSHSGSVTAPIYFCFEDCFFPTKGWSDFPLIILSWWMNELESEAEELAFGFMDGPFEIRAQRIGSNLRLTGVWRRQIGNKVMFSQLIPENDLAIALQTQAKALVYRLQDICPENPDYIELIEKLSNSISRTN